MEKLKELVLEALKANLTDVSSAFCSVDDRKLAELLEQEVLSRHQQKGDKEWDAAWHADAICEKYRITETMLPSPEEVALPTYEMFAAHLRKLPPLQKGKRYLLFQTVHSIEKVRERHADDVCEYLTNNSVYHFSNRRSHRDGWSYNVEFYVALKD